MNYFESTKNDSDSNNQLDLLINEIKSLEVSIDSKELREELIKIFEISD
tara:strand:- start:23 stop:169 length:147 start_codon:yes stop_codon:yes gene_type:complete